MRVILQRVLSASVSTGGDFPQAIGKGVVCLMGVSDEDDLLCIDKLAYKTAYLRIFEDDKGKMNLSAAELGFDLLAVPNFTLYASTKKGLRPSFIKAAEPKFALEAFDLYVERLKKYGTGKVVTGSFGAEMKVELINDGPVTILLDTKEW